MYRGLVTGFFIFYLLIPCSSAFGGSQTDKYSNTEKLFRFNPLESLSLGMVHLSTTYPVERYTFPNRDGTFADKGPNFYITGRGSGSVSSFIDFNYDLRINNIEGVRFKKGSVFLRSSTVSLEIGRNNIWLGHSQSGSLLLSNNAEPYTLIRSRTERPFRIPYIGSFDYTLFHGWPREFNIIGHQLSWYPASWFEFNIKQNIIYSDNYTFGEYLKMFTGREANISDGVGETNSRASFEIAIDVRLLSKVFPVIKNARLYAEYGGEDLYAIWQTADLVYDKDLWVGPFGFELLDTGTLSGLQITTENAEFIIEYAQNYKSHYLFYDPYSGGRPYNAYWYRHSQQYYFMNNSAIMGHQMGSAAEMLSLHYTRTFSMFTLSFFLSRRHRWDIRLEGLDLSYKRGAPERQDSFSGLLHYHINQLTLSFHLIYNSYNNADIHQNPLINNPQRGLLAREFIVGIMFTIRF